MGPLTYCFSDRGRPKSKLLMTQWVQNERLKFSPVLKILLWSFGDGCEDGFVVLITSAPDSGWPFIQSRPTMAGKCKFPITFLHRKRGTSAHFAEQIAPSSLSCGSRSALHWGQREKCTDRLLQNADEVCIRFTRTWKADNLLSSFCSFIQCAKPTSYYGLGRYQARAKGSYEFTAVIWNGVFDLGYIVVMV